MYLAEDLRLKRQAALELLAPPLAHDEAFRARFLEESQLAASLDHPNVVPIEAAGEAADELYIAMRYVEGQDLEVLLRDYTDGTETFTGPVAGLGSGTFSSGVRSRGTFDCKKGEVTSGSAKPEPLLRHRRSRRSVREAQGPGQVRRSVEVLSTSQVGGGRLTREPPAVRPAQGHRGRQDEAERLEHPGGDG